MPMGELLVPLLFTRKVTQIWAKLDNLAGFAFEGGVQPLGDGIRFRLSECILEHFGEGFHVWFVLEIRPIGAWENKHIGGHGAAACQRVPQIMDRPLRFLDSLGNSVHGATEIVPFAGAYTEGDDFRELRRNSRIGWFADLGQERIVMRDERLYIRANHFVEFVDIGLLWNGRLVEISPVLSQPPNDIGSRAITAGGRPHHQWERVFLLFVPFRFLLSPVLILLRHAALGGLKLQGGNVAGFFLSGT